MAHIDGNQRSGTVSPVRARRRLGAELERLRGARTQKAAADQLGWGLGKLKYIEAGHRALALADLQTALDAYGSEPDLAAELVALCEEGNARGWWDAYSDADLPASSKRYIGLEQGAVRIRAFTPLIVHGLLQTAGYREAVLRGASLAPRPAEQMQALIEVSRQRQALLEAPVELSFVLDEAALHRAVDPPELMREQLTYLAEVADGHDNVTMRVIPYSRGPHPGLGGSFSLLHFGWLDDPGIVYLESGPDQPDYLEERHHVYLYSQVFDRLIQVALGPKESVKMLRGVAKEFGHQERSRT